MQRTITARRAATFKHTHISLYIVATCAFAVVSFDSAQGLSTKYELNKKWWLTYAGVLLAAYLYLRPLIRRRLGSAEQGFINFYSVYIGWLCSAVFLHLPSFAALGIDVKADVSILLTTFLVTLAVVGLAHVLHSLAVTLHIMSPALYNPDAGKREAISIALLNSLTLAVACSTYFSFCGNSGEDQPAGDLHVMICRRWLRPVSSKRHPKVSRWVLYGGASTVSPPLMPDFPLESLRPVTMTGAAEAISPVFTLWLTLMIMFIANCFADYGAAQAMSAEHTSELRGVGEARSSVPSLATPKGVPRRKSFDISSLRQRSVGDLRRLNSSFLVAPMLRHAATAAGAMPHLERAASKILPEQVVDMLHNVAQYGQLLSPKQAPRAERDPALLPTPEDEYNGVGQHVMGGSLSGFDSDDDLVESVAENGGEVETARPDFMPMFPWYSGTSADMYRTIFGLVVSLKLFLGRFDMRTMQAATSAMPPGVGRAPPRDGDGYTYEHLASRNEAWLDFMADTGDGGNPTYAVARSLAAPELPVQTPAHVADPQQRHPPSEDDDFASVGGDSPRSSVASSGASTYDSAASLSGCQILPRADVLVIGGDLAYPNPSNATYEKRLFRPFEAAMPPPSHVHPGRLVTHKPDLPHVHISAGSSDSGRQDRSEGLATHDGPTAFAIPGNHDWIDGLETFQRHILHKGWLGGWLLPQEASYFALALPHGWWLFGLDLALVDDIDMCQCRYFARVAEERMGPDDAAILVTHEPRWLTEWYSGTAGAHNLRQLVRGHLRGRARVHLSGDLHFYMRHTFRPKQAEQRPEAGAAAGEAPREHTASAGGGVRPGSGTPAPGAAPSLSATARQDFVQTNGTRQHGKEQDSRSPAHLNGGLGRSGSGPPTAAQQRQPLASAASKPATMDMATIRGLYDDLLPPSDGHSSSDRPKHAGDSKGQGCADADSFSSRGDSANVVDVMSTGASRVLSPSRGLADLVPGSAPPPAGIAHSAFEPWAQQATPARQLNGEAADAGQQPEQGEPDPLGSDGSMPRATSYDSLASAFAYAPPFSDSGSSSDGSGAGAPDAGEPIVWSPPRVRLPGRGTSGVHFRPGSAEAPANGHNTSAFPGRPSLGGLSTIGSSAASELEREAVDEYPLDPEHLICNGLGGAFLHPTHVFAHAHFAPIRGREADAAFVHASRGPQTTPRSQDTRRSEAGSTSSQNSIPGEYRCASAYPSVARSLRLGRQNLHMFRLKNTRFDVIGGLVYFMLVVSVMPRCSSVGRVLAAGSLGEAASLLCAAGWEAVVAIFTESYVSLAALLAFFVLCLSFAQAGGIGSAAGPPSLREAKQEPVAASVGLRARHGGLATQLAFAGAHAALHLASAIGLMLLLELATETCIRYEKVGSDGYHSLFRWYKDFEASQFPDPGGLRARLSAWTLGLYPAVVRAAMAAFDIVEAIAVARTAMCSGGAPLTRVQALGYYIGMLCYYFVLSCPVVGWLFGCYLYVMVNWFQVHYDEAFSALRIPHYKGFSRIHINPKGELEIYAVAMDRVASEWRQDRRWRSPHGGGYSLRPSYRARWPSRWLPLDTGFNEDCGGDGTESSSIKVVDYVTVPKARPSRNDA